MEKTPRLEVEERNLNPGPLTMPKQQLDYTGTPLARLRACVWS